MIPSRLKQEYSYITRHEVCGSIDYDEKYRIWLEDCIGEQTVNWDWCIDVEMESDNTAPWIKIVNIIYFGFHEEKDLILFELTFCHG